MNRVLAIAIAALALILLPATVANAAFTGGSSAGVTARTDTLAPPTGLTNTSSCGLLLPSMSVKWTASTSTRATGYAVTMNINGTDVINTTTTGTTYGQSSLLALGNTYRITVRTMLANWTSTPVSITFVC